MPRDVVDFFEHSAIDSIRATPLGNIAARYIDVLFSGAANAVRITGEAADLSDRTEAFYLTAEDSGSEWRWLNSEGQEAWPAEDLAEKWRATSAADLFGSPRRVTFYIDPRIAREAWERPVRFMGRLQSSSSPHVPKACASGQCFTRRPITRARVRSPRTRSDATTFSVYWSHLCERGSLAGPTEIGGRHVNSG